MKISEKISIKISHNADAAIGYAAEQMQKYWELCTGRFLEIHTDWRKYDSEILIGDQDGGIIEQERLKTLKFDGYIYQVRGKKMQIASCSSRGILYGVYDFLKNIFGCRFFAKDEFLIPKTELLEIPDLIYSYSPPFEQRDFCDRSCFDPEFCVANHLNGVYDELEEKHGGFFEIGGGFCHSLPVVFDPEKYFDKHPEYFALIGGVRKKSPSQLCFTNPDLVDIAVRQILKWKRDRPDLSIFTLSQGDGYHYCECEACQRVYEEEGTRAGAMIRFLNQVAKKVRQEYPDIILDTLAYLHTRKPPKQTKLEDNIQIRLCSIECCCMDPVGTCDFVDLRYQDRSDPPTEYLEDLAGWAALTKRLFVWDYPINTVHTLLPYPNLDVIQKNIRTYRDAGVRGMFVNASYLAEYSSYSCLRGYLYAQCLWDPDADLERHYHEFMKAYYGAAWQKMEQAIAFLHERKKKFPIHMYFCSHIDRTEYYGADFCVEYGKILAEAELLADNDRVRDRIRREMLAIPMLELIALPENDKKFEEKTEEFFDRAHSLGITVFRETEPKWSEKMYRYMLRSKDWLFDRFDEFVKECESAEQKEE